MRLHVGRLHQWNLVRAVDRGQSPRDTKNDILFKCVSVTRPTATEGEGRLFTGQSEKRDRAAGSLLGYRHRLWTGTAALGRLDVLEQRYICRNAITHRDCHCHVKTPPFRTPGTDSRGGWIHVPRISRVLPLSRVRKNKTYCVRQLLLRKRFTTPMPRAVASAVSMHRLLLLAFASNVLSGLKDSPD